MVFVTGRRGGLSVSEGHATQSFALSTSIQPFIRQLTTGLIQRPNRPQIGPLNPPLDRHPPTPQPPRRPPLPLPRPRIRARICRVERRHDGALGRNQRRPPLRLLRQVGEQPPLGTGREEERSVGSRRIREGRGRIEREGIESRREEFLEEGGGGRGWGVEV